MEKDKCPNCGQEVVSLEGMSDHQKFKIFMKEKGLNLMKIAEILNRPYDSVKTALRPSGKFPDWLKITLHVWERDKNKDKSEK